MFDFGYAIFGFIVAYFVVIVLLHSIKITIEKSRDQKRIDEIDKNIEWYGPDICLKKKNYPQLEDDFREEIIDKKD